MKNGLVFSRVDGFVSSWNLVSIAITFYCKYGSKSCLAVLFGIYIFDATSSKTFYVSLHELSGLCSQNSIVVKKARARKTQTGDNNGLLGQVRPMWIKLTTHQKV